MLCQCQLTRKDFAHAAALFNCLRRDTVFALLYQQLSKREERKQITD